MLSGCGFCGSRRCGRTSTEPTLKPTRIGSHTSKILNRCDHMTKESESKINIWYHSGIRYILERILGDLRQRLSRRLSRQSATESPSRRRLVGDWSATQSPTSRHELFSKNIIPTYVRIVRRTSDRILQDATS